MHALGYALADALGHVQAVEDAQVHVKDVVPAEMLVTGDATDAVEDARAVLAVQGVPEVAVKGVLDVDRVDAKKVVVLDALAVAKADVEAVAEAVLEAVAEDVLADAVTVAVLGAIQDAQAVTDVTDVAVAAKTVANQHARQRVLIHAQINVMDIAQVVPPMLFMELNYLQNK